MVGWWDGGMVGWWDGGMVSSPNHESSIEGAVVVKVCEERR
jgi:hypothetical protein